MVLPSRGNKLLASQQRAERIQVEASSSGWQEPWELRRPGVVRNKVPEINKDLITEGLSTLQKSLEFILEALERLKIARQFFLCKQLLNLRPHVRVTVAPIYWTVVWSQLSLVGISQRLYCLYYCTRDAWCLMDEGAEVRWYGSGCISNKWEDLLDSCSF